jgi:hypothetical protein
MPLSQDPNVYRDRRPRRDVGAQSKHRAGHGQRLPPPQPAGIFARDPHLDSANKTNWVSGC